MARIRTIKPEFWTSEQVMECSPNARLLFIGLWNFCDDAGRMKFSARSVKAQVFPADDIDYESMFRMFQELSKNGLIDTYIVDGTQYLQVTGWHHQRIDKPQKSKHPPKPEGYSESVLGTVEESSSTELILMEGSLEEGNGAKDAAPVGAQSELLNDPPPIPDVEYYRRAKQILGPKQGGGLAKKLLDAKGGNLALARSALEVASTKADAREYLGAVIRGRDGKDDLRARGEAW